MEGLDNDWIQSGHRREAHYSAIPAGNYTLRTKAANHDGFWSEPKALLSLTVLPPFWQTWWFRTLCGTLLAITLLAIHSIRLNNIRRRKEVLESVIRERTEKLRNLNENQARFFSLVAHDIQKPIAGVQPFAKLLADRGDLLTKRETANIANEWYEEMTTLNRFLKDILSWSMAQMRSTACLPAPFPLFQTATTVIKELSFIAKQHNISIDNQISETVIVVADSKMIATVFRNLISNAIKHSLPNGKITISTTIKKDVATVLVKDFGAGMSPETTSKLFKPLHSHPQTMDTDADPSGLGLILCKHFVELNGGTITVASELERGSIFSFTLPLQTGESGE